MWRENSADRKGWHGERTDYDGGEDANGSLLGHLDGHLKVELSSIWAERYPFGANEIGCSISMTSRRRASSSLQQRFHIERKEFPWTMPVENEMLRSMWLGLDAA